jgi:hypothetical protein
VVRSSAKRREVIGYSLKQLKDAVGETLGADAIKPPRPRSPLKALRERVRSRISARYHSNGGVREGEWKAYRLTYSLPQVGWQSARNHGRKEGLKSARILP